MRLLTFGASWCPSCKELHRSIGNIRPILDIDYIDVDQQPNIAKRYQIIAVPTMVLIDEQGIAQKRLLGFHPLSKIRSWLNSQ